MTSSSGSQEPLVLRGPGRFILAASSGVFALIGFAMLGDPSSETGVRIGYGVMGGLALLFAVRALFRRVIVQRGGVIQVQWLRRRRLEVRHAEPSLRSVQLGVIGVWSVVVETPDGRSVVLDELSAPRFSTSQPPRRLSQMCSILSEGQ